MDFTGYKYNPTAEMMVDVLLKKNANISDPLFCRVMSAFYIAKAATMMRTHVINYDKQVVPTNLYALNLMPSGFGKGLSANLIEKNIMAEFRHNFLEETFPIKATESLTRLAGPRARKEGITEEEALDKLGAEFTGLGHLLFSFDSGTPAALKQMRTKLLMGKAGSMNFHIDEIGSNLLKSQEMLEVFLELYDMGEVKQKLVKNTAENVRLEDMEGITPANLIMFGTPVKLLDGGRTEELLVDFLLTGYGRRCFFGIVDTSSAKTVVLSPAEVLANLRDSNIDALMNTLSDIFEDLSDISQFGIFRPMGDDTALLSIEYQQFNAKRSEAFPIHDEIGKAEMLHRHWKVTKLAGAYAFLEKSPEVTVEHFQAAILLAEDSGDAFRRIMSRDKNYVRLAKYISECGMELTQADLVENLQFYKGTAASKSEMLLHAAYGVMRQCRSFSFPLMPGCPRYTPAWSSPRPPPSPVGDLVHRLHLCRRKVAAAIERCPYAIPVQGGP